MRFLSTEIARCARSVRTKKTQYKISVYRPNTLGQYSYIIFGCIPCLQAFPFHLKPIMHLHEKVPLTLLQYLLPLHGRIGHPSLERK